MARIESTARTCMRHMGQRVVATVEHIVMVDGRRYRLDVCDEHSRLLGLNLGPWINCAQEDTLGHAGLTPEQAAPVRPAAPLTVARRVEVLPASGAVSKIPVQVPGDVSGLDLEVAREWTFTRKASDRIDEQHITAVDVWRILQEPTTTKPGQFDETEVWSNPAGVEVVVNPRTKMVITVFVPYSARRISA
jgi:hypothetical protein